MRKGLSQVASEYRRTLDSDVAVLPSVDAGLCYIFRWIHANFIDEARARMLKKYFDEGIRKNAKY